MIDLVLIDVDGTLHGAGGVDPRPLHTGEFGCPFVARPRDGGISDPVEHLVKVGH